VDKEHCPVQPLKKENHLFFATSHPREDRGICEFGFKDSPSYLDESFIQLNLWKYHLRPCNLDNQSKKVDIEGKLSLDPGQGRTTKHLVTYPYYHMLKLRKKWILRPKKKRGPLH